MHYLENKVALAKSIHAHYCILENPVSAPELPSGLAKDASTATIRSLFYNWGLDQENYGKQ